MDLIYGDFETGVGIYITLAWKAFVLGGMHVSYPVLKYVIHSIIVVYSNACMQHTAQNINQINGTEPIKKIPKWHDELN